MSIISFKRYTAVLGLYVDLTGRMVLQVMDGARAQTAGRGLSGRHVRGADRHVRGADELHKLTREILEDIRKAVETQMVPIGLDRRLNEAAEAYPVLTFLASTSSLIRQGRADIEISRIRQTALRYWPNDEQVELLIKKWITLDKMDRVESGWALSQQEIDAAWAAWSVGDSKTAWDIIDVREASGGTNVLDAVVKERDEAIESMKKERL